MNDSTMIAEKFKQRLGGYKELIDADIHDYTQELIKSTADDFGSRSEVAVDGFVQILNRGGKRIRGALLMAAYELAGGTDQSVAIKAARAVEMMHAYILMIDDIQDKSELRRGGPSAHKLIQQLHDREMLAGDGAHFGVALALNGALIGAHQAQVILSELPVDAEIRLALIKIMNNTMTVTAHGQTNDIYNEVASQVSQQDIDNVLNWKTAQYTFVSPLKMGVVLAGASEEAYHALFSYGEAAGFAFQITDDIIGIFGDQAQTGKSTMDDIKEGKRTLLSAYALEHSDQEAQSFLRRQLGNEQITQGEFEQVKALIKKSGALTHAEEQADGYIQKAKQSLQLLKKNNSHEALSFLEGLADALKGRGA